MCEPVVKIDDVASAAYISLNKHSIALTVELTPNIVLDLDGDCSLVGIEYLSLEEKFPMESPVLRGIDITTDCRKAILAFEDSQRA